MLIGFVGLCLLVAAADAGLTEPGMRHWYPALRHPPGTPPDWLFPCIWIPLYVFMAVAAWRVWRRSPADEWLPDRIAALGGDGALASGGAPSRLARPRVLSRQFLRRRGLLLWSWQLVANALWTPLFFGLHRPVPALALILSLAALVALTWRDFRRVDHAAGVLMAPYFVWVCYAAWLNAGIAWLNPAFS